MTGGGPGSSDQAAWDAVPFAQLRDDLRLSPADRLAVAEALLLFALRTPHYTPKADLQRRPDR